MLVEKVWELEVCLGLEKMKWCLLAASDWPAVVIPPPLPACSVSEAEYTKAIEDEIKSVVKLQVELDLDVLVHGEPEVRGVEFSHNENDIECIIKKMHTT